MGAKPISAASLIKSIKLASLHSLEVVRAGSTGENSTEALSQGRPNAALRKMSRPGERCGSAFHGRCLHDWDCFTYTKRRVEVKTQEEDVKAEVGDRQLGLGIPSHSRLASGDSWLISSDGCRKSTRTRFPADKQLPPDGTQPKHLQPSIQTDCRANATSTALFSHQNRRNQHLQAEGRLAPLPTHALARLPAPVKSTVPSTCSSFSPSPPTSTPLPRHALRLRDHEPICFIPESSHLRVRRRRTPRPRSRRRDEKHPTNQRANERERPIGERSRLTAGVMPPKTTRRSSAGSSS